VNISSAPSTRLACPGHLDLALDVRDGLGRAGDKTLPPRWLYDDVGSSLFEAICLMPEYGVTRAETRILQRCAPQLAARLGRVPRVVELGSGSGRKTRGLLTALLEHGPVDYRPVDLSAAALAACHHEFSEVPGLEVHEIRDEFLAGLRTAARERPLGQPMLVLFLGGTLGNFERGAAADFLRELRSVLCPGDALLLGTDLVQPEARLLEAYDDPVGITAAFDLNLLARLNRELGANFDLLRFAHEARWNAAERRVEMHLRARSAQVVDVPGAGLRVGFREGETVRTEVSCKYGGGEPVLLAALTGFRCLQQWFDAEWPFAENLWLAV
jgi:L-histidine N-alpha-methyltransferase